jgi:molybdopterin converting factor small subunit
MPVKVIIPTPLRQYAEKKESLEVQAKTVAEALNAVTALYSDLRKHLYNDEGKLRSFVNIYVGDEDIRFLQKQETPLKENDVISIVPSIAGGTDPSCFSRQTIYCICS